MISRRLIALAVFFGLCLAAAALLIAAHALEEPFGRSTLVAMAAELLGSGLTVFLMTLLGVVPARAQE
jgi:hypothetical protein